MADSDDTICTVQALQDDQPTETEAEAEAEAEGRTQVENDDIKSALSTDGKEIQNKTCVEDNANISSVNVGVTSEILNAEKEVDNFEVIDAAKERNVGSSVPVEEFTTNVEQKDEATSLILTDSINIKEARLRFSAGSKKSFMIRKKTISGSPKKNELESILFKFREKDESDTTTPESDTVVFQKVWPDGSITDFNSLADVIKGEKLTQDNRPPQMSLGCAVNVATARALFTKGRRISLVRKNTKESHADNTDSLSHIDEIPADDQVTEFTLVGDDTSFDSNTNEGGVTTAVKKDDGYAYFTVHTGADQPTEIKRITE